MEDHDLVVALEKTATKVHYKPHEASWLARSALELLKHKFNGPRYLLHHLAHMRKYRVRDRRLHMGDEYWLTLCPFQAFEGFSFALQPATWTNSDLRMQMATTGVRVQGLSAPLLLMPEAYRIARNLDSRDTWIAWMEIDDLRFEFHANGLFSNATDASVLTEPQREGGYDIAFGVGPRDTTVNRKLTQFDHSVADVNEKGTFDLKSISEMPPVFQTMIENATEG